MLDEYQDQQEQLKEMLKNPKDLIAAVEKLEAEHAALRNELENIRKEQAIAKSKVFAEKIRANENHCYVAQTDEDLNALKDALIALRNEIPDMALIMGSTFQGKPSLLVVLGEEQVKNGRHAGNIIRAAAKEIQGGGGGQPFFATAGGKNPDGLSKALEIARQLL